MTTPVWPWSAWQCDENHKVWFSAVETDGDYTMCIRENCKVLAFSANGGGANGVFVRSLMFDHENYPWRPDEDWLPEYMQEPSLLWTISEKNASGRR